MMFLPCQRPDLFGTLCFSPSPGRAEVEPGRAESADGGREASSCRQQQRTPSEGWQGGEGLTGTAGGGQDGARGTVV